MKSKKYILAVTFLAVLVLVSTQCAKLTGPQGPQGPAGPQGPVGPAGTSCTATQVSSGVQVTCTDGTSALVLNGANGTAGAQGAPGTNGAAGANGHSALLVSHPNDTQCGIAGGTLLLGGVDLNDDGILENNEVTVSADICNGAQGPQGTQGASGSSPQYSPVIVINPCGPNSSSYKEALLGLSGGGVFGSFTASSNALTVRNTLLPDGSYYDTDDSECYFSVSTSSGDDRTVSWNGSTANGTGPFGAGYASYDPTTSAQWVGVYTPPGN